MTEEYQSKKDEESREDEMESQKDWVMALVDSWSPEMRRYNSVGYPCPHYKSQREDENCFF